MKIFITKKVGIKKVLRCAGTNIICMCLADGICKTDKAHLVKVFETKLSVSISNRYVLMLVATAGGFFYVIKEVSETFNRY